MYLSVSSVSLHVWGHVINLIVLERSRLTTILIKITTHLKRHLQDMFRSYNDHLQLKVELI